MKTPAEYAAKFDGATTDGAVKEAAATVICDLLRSSIVDGEKQRQFPNFTVEKMNSIVLVHRNVWEETLELLPESTQKAAGGEEAFDRVAGYLSSLPKDQVCQLMDEALAHPEESLV